MSFKECMALITGTSAQPDDHPLFTRSDYARAVSTLRKTQNRESVESLYSTSWESFLGESGNPFQNAIFGDLTKTQRYGDDDDDGDDNDL
ncbi:hypothetical protein Slin14017_G094310 [Septoria linicola]|nr:hypothetical protein Slin14017_G094310 [Septoria linicola]